jgi:hypothetical protein
MASEDEVLGKVRKVTELALEDTEFEARLAEDPWGVAATYGFTREDAATALGLDPSAPDAEVAEALRERVARTDWGRELPDVVLDSIP